MRTLFSSHRPLVYLKYTKTVFTDQSTTMARVTPTTPQPNLIPKSQEKKTLHTTVENMEAPMTHFTSPAALRPLGRALCTEQRKAKAKLWMKIITRASILVSLERAKQEIIRGETTRRNTFQRIENTNDIRNRYFE